MHPCRWDYCRNAYPSKPALHAHLVHEHIAHEKPISASTVHIERREDGEMYAREKGLESLLGPMHPVGSSPSDPSTQSHPSTTSQPHTQTPPLTQHIPTPIRQIAFSFGSSAIISPGYGGQTMQDQRDGRGAGLVGRSNRFSAGFGFGSTLGSSSGSGSGSGAGSGSGSRVGLTLASAPHSASMSDPDGQNETSAARTHAPSSPASGHVSQEIQLTPASSDSGSGSSSLPASHPCETVEPIRGSSRTREDI